MAPNTRSFSLATLSAPAAKASTPNTGVNHLRYYCDGRQQRGQELAPSLRIVYVCPYLVSQAGHVAHRVFTEHVVVSVVIKTAVG